MPRKRQLGKWQIKSLLQIVNHEVCCHRAVIDMIGGTAKKWDRRYKLRLKSAIAAHNAGIATNSPVNPKLQIEEDTRTGFKLVSR
jgi:hypothetical protein